MNLSDNWIVANLENAFGTWNDKMTEIWSLITTSPQNFKGGAIWSIVTTINGGLQAIGYALLILFFAMSIFKSNASFRDFQRPEYALKHFIRFLAAKVAITYALDLMTVVYKICGGVVEKIAGSLGGIGGEAVTLPAAIETAVEGAGFWASIPLWLVTILGSLFITVLSFIMIMTVYGRFFKLYMYTALAPVPLSSFAGEGTSQMGKAFITVYNKQLNRNVFEQFITPTDHTDKNKVTYTKELKELLSDKMSDSNNIVHEKCITVSSEKKNIEEARTFFARVGNDLTADFGKISSHITELNYKERLRIFYDFFHGKEGGTFNFDLKKAMAVGSDFKDYICFDSMEFKSDYIKIGDRFARVIFLKEYPSFLKDSMLSELTDFSRNMMLSMDIQPIPIFFKNPYSAEFLLKAWRRFRKYGGLLMGSTQNVEECLKNDTARWMISNSEFLLMFNQSPSDRAELASMLNISPAQMGYITNSSAGRGLIKVGGSIVPFINDFPADTELYKLMSTKPGEE